MMLMPPTTTVRTAPKRPASAVVVDIRTRDAERTRAEILEAATAEFADVGLGGARMDGIAERAKVNKRLLYYYFNSKDKLFSAVLEAAYARIREAEQALRLDDMPPATALRRMVEFTWNYYLDHPEFLTLLNSENLHKARHLQASDRIREMNSPVIQTLGRILERGRADGVFRGGIDPLQLYISIASLAYFYLSNNHTLAAVFGRSLATKRAMEERLSHITEVVLGYTLTH